MDWAIMLRKWAAVYRDDGQEGKADGLWKEKIGFWILGFAIRIKITPGSERGFPRKKVSQTLVFSFCSEF
jgi:hypothetical protein